MARGRDSLDLVIERWAVGRRGLLGLKDSNQAWPHGWQWLGAPDCTLANVREMQDGAGSGGQVKQHFPEVYTGLSYEINRAFNHMDGSDREIMDVHYTFPGTTVKVKAWRMGIGTSRYWTRVEVVKGRIDSWLRRSKLDAAGMSAQNTERMSIQTLVDWDRN